MTPDTAYGKVVIDECSDDTCTDATPFSGSPFKTSSTPHQIYDLGTTSTGFVRVGFPAQWSGHTQARFVLYYNTNLTSMNLVRSGLPKGSWHYISAMVEPINENSNSASVYVNGTLFAGPVFFLRNASGLAFAGQHGISLGRSYPMSAPFGYFKGYIDELMVVDRIISASLEVSCSAVPETILCYSFDKATVLANGSFYDLGIGQSSNAVPVSQDRFLPWCITMSDGGELVIDDFLPEEPYGVLSWGFCTSKARLPGAGLNYDAEMLNSLLSEEYEKGFDEFRLKNLPGCSNAPLIFDGNVAGR